MAKYKVNDSVPKTISVRIPTAPKVIKKSKKIKRPNSIKRVK